MAKNFLKQVMDKQPEGSIDTKAFIAKIESGYVVGKGEPEQLAEPEPKPEPLAEPKPVAVAKINKHEIIERLKKNYFSIESKEYERILEEFKKM